LISLFRRAARFQRSVAVDPRENRLTEAFAAVLERDPLLTTELVKRWTSADVPEGSVSVRTQRLTASGAFIDLELAFGSLAAPNLRVWVEVKHGAGLHENQLETYLDDLKVEHHAESRLVFLAPRGATDAVRCRSGRMADDRLVPAGVYASS
jgi:hypothetical protein